jgi:uncharacterized membrane protein YhaH (DUF805 family)
VATGADQGATLFLTAMQFMLGVLAVIFVFIGAFDVSCVVDCQYGLKGVAIQLMFAVALVLPIVSIVVTAVRRHNDPETRNWWVAGAGVVVIGATFVLCLALEAAAVNKPFPY